MRALGSGQHLLRGFGWRELNGVFQAEGLATDHFEPGPPDATAWPVAPEHRRVGSGALTVSGGGEAPESEEESGHSTALTRRGFRVVLLT
jgi:hypothetical protein